VEPLIGVLLETVPHDPVERGGQSRVQGRRFGRLLFQNGAHGFNRRFALECAPSGESLEQDYTETEDIRSRIDGEPAHLLGRHVAGRAHHHAGLRREHFGGRAGRVRTGGLRRQQFGEAEIQDFQPAVFGEEEVLGFQVPVYDALGMSRGEPAGGLHRVVNRFTRRDGSPAQAVAQCFAFEQFFDDVDRPVFATDIVNGDDIRVVQRARGAGLLLEARAALGIEPESAGQDFDGDVAAQARIARAVDLAHPAGAHRRQNLIRSKPCPRRHLHGWRALYQPVSRVDHFGLSLFSSR
jgi:hypothetical protein